MANLESRFIPYTIVPHLIVQIKHLSALSDIRILNATFSVKVKLFSTLKTINYIVDIKLHGHNMHVTV